MTRFTALLLTLLISIHVTATTLDVSIQNLQTQVTLRLETGSIKFEHTYFEDLEITQDGDYRFLREMIPGEFFKISVTDQPDAQACTGSVMQGVFQEGQDMIQLSCLDRSVTLTRLAPFSHLTENQLRTVVTAKSRDTEQAVSGLREEDFDIVQDEGSITQLLFSEQPEYFHHVLPLSAMAPQFHWVLSYDVSNSVTMDEMSAINLHSRDFITALAGEGDENLPDNVSITINSFDHDVTTHVSQSQNVADLHAAIDSLTRSNGGSDLYDSSIASLDMLTTRYTATNVETGAVIVITDGPDTVGTSSSFDVQQARGDKPLYFVGIGSDIDEAQLLDMADTAFPERVVTASDFTSLNDILDGVAGEFMQLIDGSYLVMLASPLKDSLSHIIRIDLADQISCLSDQISPILDPTCNDDYVGSYLFHSQTIASPPETVVLGDGRLNQGELSPLLVKTLWSDDTPDYSVAIANQFSEITLTGNEQNSALAVFIDNAKVVSTVTLTDNNWGVSAQKGILGPQLINVNLISSGEEDVQSFELTRNVPLLDFDITNISLENESQWQVSLPESDYLTLVELINGPIPEYRLLFNPGAAAVSINTALRITDTANSVTRDIPLSATADQINAGDFEDVLAYVTWLIRYGLDINTDPQGDVDGDGLTNFQEFHACSNPGQLDSDFDGIADLAEMNSGSSLTSAFYQISIGVGHSCLLDDEGIQCHKHEGITHHSGIEAVPTLSHPRKVTSGQHFSCALDEQGLTCWGINNGSVINAPDLQGISDLASGFRHSCVIVQDSVSCWGAGSNEVLETPVGLSNPGNLTVGHNHACV